MFSSAIRPPPHCSPLQITETTQGAANKYKVYQKVQVYRSGDGWVTGTVNKYKSDGVGSWLYKLVDGKGREIWVDQPTWFSEAQLDRFSRGEKY